jgi:predicted dehydrogenase
MEEFSTASKFQFLGRAEPSPMTHLVIVGPGDVVSNKIWPALRNSTFRFARIAVCGIEDRGSLTGLPHEYYRISAESLLPLDTLSSDGFLGPQTLYLITTPSHLHVHYALQLAGRCGRLAIEKPIARNGRQAQLLRPFASSQCGVYPIDHKLFTLSALRFVEQCREDSRMVGRIRRIQGQFFESSAFVKSRAQENTLADIQWHLLAILIAVFKTTQKAFEIAIHSSQTSRHFPDPAHIFADASVVTASRLKGTILKTDSSASFDLAQAKAAPLSDKSLRFFDECGDVVGEIDLNETGHEAHRRLIEALVEPQVDMRHTLDDAITLTSLVEDCVLAGREHAPYEFGSLSSFLLPI